MTIYYKNGGFYLELQESAIEISEELHERLMIGQSEGKQIVTGLDGMPMLAEQQPSQYHQWDGTAWTISPEQQAALLAEQREKVRSKINELRDRKINGGVYVPAIDKWIDSDTRAVQSLLSVKATFDLFGNDLNIVWTCADNSNIKMTKEVMSQIWQAMQHNINTNHGNAISHKNALEQSENPLEYDYSGGWTQTYEEYQNA